MSKSDLKTKTRLAMGELLDRVLGSVSPRHPATPSRALDLSELEERILLSASPMMAVAEMAEPAPAEAMAEESALMATEAAPSPDSDSSTSQQSNTNLSTNPSQNVSHEVVFLDTSVEDYQQLLNDLWSNDDPSREIEVVLLSGTRDGIDQISEALASRNDLDAIHIVSHGTDAAVKLGSTWLTQDNLAGYVGEIARWGDSLSTDADLLFYGCDLAATSDGQSLIDSLATLTGADVAASDNDTGHAIFDADWDLEYATGQIETQIAFSQATQDGWGHIMNVAVEATSTGTIAKDNLSGTISHTTSGSNRLMLVGISFGQDHDESIASVTYNGANLTLVGTRDNGDSSKSRVEIWSLLAPDIGTHDVVVNVSDDGHDGVAIGVMTFTNVDQGTPLGTFASAQGDSSTASATVGSASGELVFGVVAIDNSSNLALTPGSGQAEQWDLFADDKGNGGGSTESGAASVTTSWTWGSSDKWVVGGVSIKPAANGSTSTSFRNGDSNGYSSTVDTFLDAGEPTTDKGSDVDVAVDLDDGAGDATVQGLIRFDSIFGSAADQIPSGATITSAQLRLNVNNPSIGSATIGLHQMLVNWTDSSTWNSLSSGVSTNGVEAASAADATISDPTATGSVTVSGLESTVQAWLDGDSENYGWVIVSDSDNGWDFDSSDSLTAGLRPQLLVSYIPNTAPVLNDTVVTLNSVAEDAGAPSGAVGTLISTLVDLDAPAGGLDNVTDDDTGAVTGIAITAAETTNGTWHHSINGGTNWNALGTVSTTNALLLAADADTRIYFQSNSDYNGTIANAITFHAWDQTSSTNGGTADVTASISTVIDQFSTVGYSNNDGTANWTSNWIESDDDGSAATGNIRVEGDELRLDSQDGGGLESITRSFDLANASAANLTFDFGGYVFSGTDNFAIDISNDGGSNWVELEEISYVSSPGENISGNRDYDLTSFVSLTTDMAVRFRVSSGFAGAGQHVTFDDIQVSSTVDSTGGQTAFSTATDTASITVTPVNDDPVATIVPITYGFSEDSSALTLSGLNVSDVDADSGDVEVSLSVNDGDLTLVTTTGLSFTGGANGSSSITVTGTLTDLNNALDTLTYQPDLNYFGSDTFTLTIDDQGNTGGGDLTDFDTAGITVSAVNDDPENGGSLPTDIAVAEDLSSNVDLSAVDFSDVDADSGTLTVTLTTSTGGQLSASSFAGVSVNGTATARTFTGTLTNLNNYFDDATRINYLHGTANTAGDDADSLTVIINDNGNTGTGGGLDQVLGTVNVDITADNDAPTISAIANQTPNEDTATGDIAFTVSDVETAAGSLVVTATSDDQTIVPDANITLGSSGANRTINVLPGTNQNGGPATITVSVFDGTDTTQTTFDVTVGADNDAPTISALGNQTIAEDGTTGALAFSVSDVETAAGSLTVTASSSNTTIIPNANLTLVDQGSGNWTIEAAPALNQNGGPVTITVTVDDGTTTTDETFNVTVTAVDDAPTFFSSLGDGMVSTDVVSGDDYARSVAVQPDGKIVVVGRASNGTNDDIAVVRYNADGTLDTSFDVDGMLILSIGSGDDSGEDVLVQPDGKILIAGRTRNGSDFDAFVVRYNADGTLDTSFDGDGIVTMAVGSGDDRATSIALQDDGKIVVAGRSDNGSNNDIMLVRLNANGTLDSSFDGDGILTTAIGSGDDRAESVTVQTDGRILVTGRYYNGSDQDVVVARYNTNGTLDASFSGDGILTTAVGPGNDVGRAIALQSDGKILVAGYASNGADTDILVVRYNADGTPDTSFDSDGLRAIDLGTGNDFGLKMTLQPDGKILVVGQTDNGTNDDVAVVRLNTDGTLDSGFGTGGILTTAVGPGDDVGRAIAIQSDGKIVIAGESDNGSSYEFVAVRYNADGQLDLEFDGVTTLDGTPTFTEDGAAVVLDADVDVSDAELDALNGGAGNYSGGVLTLVRNDGTDADDMFAFNDGNGITLVSGSLNKNGQAIATFDTTTTTGQLVLTFTDGNGETPTSADVDNILRQTTYANSSNTPPGSVQADWAFDDGTGSVHNATGSTTVAITPTNDAPTISAIGNQTIAEEGTTGALAFSVSDAETAAESLTVTASSSNTTIIPNGNLTLVDGGSGNWTIEASPALHQNGGPVTITVTVDDGTTTTDETFNVTATAVNDAPVFDTAGSTTFNTITEDQVNNAGQTVASVIASVAGDRITDVDSGDPEGIAIIAAAETNGTLEYSLNGGTNWNALDSVATNNALLLRETDLIRFNPDGENGGTSAISFHAWDQSSGTAGNKVDATTTGDSSAFSVGFEGVLITVTDVNDNPSGAGSLTTTSLNDNDGATNLFGGLSVTDVDTGEADLSLTITLATPSAGTLSGGGFTETAPSTGIYTVSGLTTATADTALDNVQFTPTDNTGPSGTFNTEMSVTANDQGGGGEQTVLTATIVTVTRINDAPVADLNGADGAGTDYSTTFNEGNTPVSVANTDATISDADDSTFQNLGVNLSGFVDGTSEEIHINGEIFTYSVSKITTTTVGTTLFNLDFDGTGFTIADDGGGTIPEADIQALLRIVSYENTSLNPTAGNRTFNIIPQDSISLNGTAAVSTVSVSGVNTPPTLTAFAGSVDTTLEDTEVEVTFAELATQGNESDPDGTVTAFIVKSVPTGTLKIGLTAGTATAYSAGSNNVIDATRNAYWTPTLNSNGTGNAFTVVARDNLGLESIGNIAVPVEVTPVNDDPTITAIADQTPNEDTATGAIAFTVGDIETAAGSLTVTATSSDQTLVPDANITLGGSGSSRSINVLPGTNQNGGPATITVSVFDGTETTQTTFDVTVTAVNDAPVASISLSGYGVDEDDSQRILTGVSVSDVDAEGNDVAVTVSVDDGDLTVTTTTGLTFTAGANGSSAFTAEGTISELNAALGTLRYQPDPNFNGTDTFTLFVDDLGNSGGGSLTSMDSVPITVTAVNDAPLLDLDADDSSLATGNDFNQSFEEGAGPVSMVDANVSLSDIDSANLASITVALQNRLDSASEESLSADASGTPLSANWNSGTDTLTIDGPGTVAEYLNVLRTVQYDNTSNNPDTTTRTITFVANDGISDSLIATTTLTFSAVNDAPVINSDGGAGTAAVSVAENVAEVTTVTSTDVDGGTPVYSISGGADSTKFSIDNGTGILKFVSAPDFESPTDTDGDNDYDYEVTVQVSDQNGGFDTQTITVTVTAENDNDPVITSDGGGASFAVDVAENSTAVTTVTATDADLPAQTLSYSISGGADSTKFNIDSDSGVLTFATAPDFDSASDTDGDNDYEVTVEVSDGAGRTDSQDITVSVTDLNDTTPIVDGGQSFFVIESATDATSLGTVTATDPDTVGSLQSWTIVSGNTSSAFAIDSASGELTVNNAAALDFETLPTFTLTVRVSDGANTSADQTVTVNVTNANDAPLVSAPASDSVDVGETLTFATADGNAITVSDVEESELRIQLSVDDGTLTLSGDTGLVFLVGTGTADATMTFEGSIASINAALDGLEHVHGDNHDGICIVTIEATDFSATGSGGPLTSTDMVAISVLMPAGPPISGDAFLQGDFLEVGFGEDGILGSQGNAPVGFNSAGANLGVEVDHDRDGFSTGQVDGDFVLPGTPEEAFGVSVGGTTTFNSNSSSQAIAGSLSNFQDTGTTQSLDFNGTASGLLIDATHSVGISDQFIDVAVTLTNSTGSTMSDVYYFRNVDPDNNFDTSGTFATTNTIVSQGDDGSAQAYVTATQADGSLLGLLGFGENARVTYGGFTNRDPIAIWDGSGGLSQTGTSTADEAVSLAFKFDSIEAGESVTLNYRYVFGETQAPILDLDPDGSTRSAARNVNSSYAENDGAIAIVDTDATIFDGDSTNLTGLTVQITNDLDSAAESLSVDTTGTSIFATAYNSTTGVLSLSGADTVANYRQVLRTISYTNTSETPDTTTRQINFSTTDGTFTSNTARAFVSVAATNDLPVINSDGGADSAAVSVAENSTEVTTVTSTDLDLDTPNYSITGGADSTKFNIDSDSGALTFAAAPDFENATDSDTDNQYEVTVTVSDGQGGTDSQDISVTVTAVNDNRPVITSNGGGETATIDVAENSTAVTTVTATDADLPAQDLDYTISGGADAARFDIDAASGELTFATAPNFEAATDSENDNTYEVIVRVSDGISFFNLQTITVSVTDVDEFDVSPISDANGGADSVNENASDGVSVGIRAFATDDDGTNNTVTYSLDEDSNGEFFIETSAGDVKVAGPIDRESGATRTIVVRATSEDGSFTTKSFTIAINDVNEFDITAISDSDGEADNVDENAAAGTTVGITASASDADATTSGITYSLDDDSNGEFQIDASSGEVTVAATIDRESGATRTITVRAASEDGSFSTKDFTIAINDLDEFDVSAIIDADGGSDNVNENASTGVSVGVRASAVDDDATTNEITYSLDDDSNGEFFIEGSAGDVKVAGPIDREAGPTRTITVRATSEDGSFTTKDFTIVINDLNDNAPIIDPDQSFSVSEFAADGDNVGTATATDQDTVGLIQNWSIANGNSDGIFEIDAASGEIRVVDNDLLNFETAATYLLGLRVEDGANVSSTQTVTINVVDENDVPVLDVNAGTSVFEGGSVLITSTELSVSDEDELPEEITYSIIDAPTAGRLELVDDPGIAISTFTQADIDNSQVRFVHDRSEADDSFTFTISDESGGTVGTTLFSIANLRVNDAPVNTTPAAQTVDEDSPLVFSISGGNSIAVSDVDLNGGMIGVRLVATNGTLTLSSTTGLVFANGDGDQNLSMVFAGTLADVNSALDGLRFDPAADFNGAASIRIVSRDMGASGSGGEQIDDDTINIEVVPVNDNPIATDDEYSTSEDNSLTVSAANGLLSNDSDIDGDDLVVTLGTGTANGTLSLNADGSFIYTPNANFNGTDSFTYQATDDSLVSEIQTVTLTVTSVNDASVSIDDEFTVDQLSVLKVRAADGVLVNDLDVEADGLQAILVDGPQNGKLILNADGSLTYTPDATFFGEDTFTYQAFDGTDDGSIATVRIDVLQTVTSGSDGGDGDIVVEEEADTSDGDEAVDGDNGTTDAGPDAAVDDTGEVSTESTLTAPPTVNANEDTGSTTVTTNTQTELEDGSANGSGNEQPLFEAAFRIDERGVLRDRLTGRIIEDAGVVVFTSTDVGSMVYVLEQTGFWTELDTFEQDVQNSILQEGEWEELVVETTTVAGTTLTVGYIVWLLRSGSVVFGLVSSLPAWTMMDPLPVLQSGLEGLGETDNTDDDSLQGILQAHHDGMELPAESFES